MSIQENSNIKTTKSVNEQIILKGIPSSPGMAHGKAFVLIQERIITPSQKIPKELIQEELNKFEKAVNELVEEFISAISKLKEDSKNVAAVIESDMMILTDEAFLNSIKNTIANGFSSENAIIREFDNQIHYLKKASDSILKERALELEHMKEKLIAVLRNTTLSYESGRNLIIVTRSLTPTDIVHFKEVGALAFITEVGGLSSHSSILARSYEIPEVIGMKNAVKSISHNSNLIVDGYTGLVTVNPNRETISEYVIKKRKEQEKKDLFGEYLKLESKTLDGKKIILSANVSSTNDIKNAIMYGAEGVGLVRTEQLIITKNYIPSENEQYEWYKLVVEPIYPKTVTIRAFDIGSDKYSEGMPKNEDNPALGFRGIRFLLYRKDIFKSQIRAILRVSKDKNVKLMLPLITSYVEIKEALELINECKNELRNESIDFDNSLPVGIMVETPAAALLAKQLGKYVSFFSIGTNDLTQYTLAVDRSNEFVSAVYDAFHPSVLSLIKMTAQAGANNNIPVSICGEIAGHAAATSLLIGLGITELSVSPLIIPELKKRVREIKYKEAKKTSKDILKTADCSYLRESLKDYI
jgi:phosphoenolpyruvate-protein phosphotransferase (PTS system enzyme I)